MNKQNLSLWSVYFIPLTYEIRILQTTGLDSFYSQWVFRTLDSRETVILKNTLIFQYHFYFDLI